ncbi:MAG: MFS transporter [Burkholderiales bacterium]
MSQRITPSLTLVMAVAAGLSVANIYYNQPMLGLMEGEFGVGSSVTFVPSATQLGYALGLILLVPLGDTLERRRLILWQVLGLALALAAAALAPTPALLVFASVAIGMGSTIAQQIIPFAAELASPQTRGHVVGTVMSGLLTGILLARTVSGFVGEYANWRIMFGVGAVMVVLMGTMLALTLPRCKPAHRHAYGELLFSLLDLARSQPALRRAVLIQGVLFAGFSAFWTTLALLLQDAPFHLGSDAAGLFGIIGLAGILIAPRAGRIADARGPHGMIGLGALLVLAAFIVFAFFRTLPGLGLGVLLLDAGVQMAMVSNQSVIFALNPRARNRINTVFMTGMFLAGAAGSAAATLAWNTQGWRGVTGLGALFAMAALAVQLMGRSGEKYS